MLTEEQWRPVVGYEGLYEVSDLGRVRTLAKYRFPERIMRPQRSPSGYAIVHLTREKRSTSSLIHRLVMEAFVGPRPANKCVNHIDNNRANPAVSNLEYVTAKQNTRHAMLTGGLREQSWSKKAAITGDRLRLLAAYGGAATHAELAEIFGVSKMTISKYLGRLGVPRYRYGKVSGSV